MYFEILNEDKSGGEALKIFVPKIIKNENSHTTIRSYYGLGKIPENLTEDNIKGAMKKQLLSELPAVLRAYEKTYGNNKSYALIVVCDLDDKNEDKFRAELEDMKRKCSPKLLVQFCFAIEESEAWLLGDIEAVKKAYKNCNLKLLRRYEYDSICCTWERLADIVYSGGSKKLKEKSMSTGSLKCEWAKKIAPLVNIETNKSPSFQKFRDTLRALE